MAERTAADRIREQIDRQLTPAEAEAYLSAPITEFEREEILALWRWFCRRYPTPLARSAYVREAYARWQRATASGLLQNRSDQR